jgi:hypothetical protein
MQKWQSRLAVPLWAAILALVLPIAAQAVATESFIIQCSPSCSATAAAINQIPGARVVQI